MSHILHDCLSKKSLNRLSEAAEFKTFSLITNTYRNWVAANARLKYKLTEDNLCRHIVNGKKKPMIINL